jgi:hypothetical protein
MSFAKDIDKETVSSTSEFSVSANEWSAVKALNQTGFICKHMLKEYIFENEFKSLFSYSYLNRDIAIIKKMSLEMQKQMQDSCKKSQNTGFNVQVCFEACSKNYLKADKKEVLTEQCQVSCSSLKNKIDSLVPQLAALLDEVVVHADKCEKTNIQINNSSRDKSKERAQDTGSATSTGVTGAQK